MSTDYADFEPMSFTSRYHRHTAKNSIESFAQVVEEIASNEDEAIRWRARRDSSEDSGWIRFDYDPESTLLEVTGNGSGMTMEMMRQRLQTVGESAHRDAIRGFFHRGVREVLFALGGGTIGEHRSHR